MESLSVLYLILNVSTYKTSTLYCFKLNFLFSATADKVISQLECSGLLNKWAEIPASFNSQQGKKAASLRNANKAQNDINLEIVSLAIVLYPIYILTAGCLTSLIVFIYEVYVKLRVAQEVTDLPCTIVVKSIYN